MKVLILGASGMLGHKLALDLGDDFEVAGTLRRDSFYLVDNPHFKKVKFFEIRQENSLQEFESIINDFMPSILVNCIGVIKHAVDEKSTGDFVWANAWLPHALAQIAADRGIRVVTFSTDCVFSGMKGQLYTLQDNPDPADIYGMSKYLGELREAPGLTLRTSIIGPELRGKKSLVEWAISQKGKSVKAYTRALYSGFPTIEISGILRRLFREQPNLTGLWQAASPGISKAELLRLLDAALRLNLELEDYGGFYCDRRLDGSEFTQKTGIVSPGWPELIDRMAADYFRYKKLYCQ